MQTKADKGEGVQITKFLFKPAGNSRRLEIRRQLLATMNGVTWGIQS